jgi:peptidoglycan/xylan/chitin deacetylase (PgdA/CDA1 family)
LSLALNRNQVLVYHKIDFQREIGITFVNPHKFQQQVEFFRRQSFELVTLNELYPSGNQRGIALTFDDGYEDIYQYAYPILAQYGLKATIFLISGFIGKQNRWDVNLGGIRFRHLNREQIRELVKAGWEMGSHTVSHCCLVGLPREKISLELKQSKQTIEDLTGQAVHFLAAPFGKVNRHILDLAQEIGYAGVCGFFPFRYIKNRIPPGFIPRLAVYATNSLGALKNKLDQGWRFRLEVSKQNVINFCANGTILVSSLR